MEWLDDVWKQISTLVSVEYMVIFMLLSYIVKKHFEELLNKVTNMKWKSVYTVLIIASLVSVPFLVWGDQGWVKIAVSYTVGTSLHELIFQWLEKKITT